MISYLFLPDITLMSHANARAAPAPTAPPLIAPITVNEYVNMTTRGVQINSTWLWAVSDGDDHGLVEINQRFVSILASRELSCSCRKGV